MNISLEKRIMFLWLWSISLLYVLLPLVFSRGMPVIYFAFAIIGLFFFFKEFKNDHSLKYYMCFVCFLFLMMFLQQYFFGNVTTRIIQKLLSLFFVVLAIPILSQLFKKGKNIFLNPLGNIVFLGTIIAFMVCLILLFMYKDTKFGVVNLGRVILTLVLLTPGILYSLQMQEKKILMILFYCFIFLVSFKSYSETALMCLIFLPITIFLIKKLSFTKYLLMAFSFAIVILIPFLFNDFVLKIIISGIEKLPSSIPEKIFLDRLDIWKQVANHIMQNFYTYKFWIGEGFQATEYVVKMSSNGNIAYMLSTIAHAHNFFLQIWLEFGMVGVLLTSFIMFKFFKWVLMESREKQPYLFGSFVIIFSALNVNFSLTETWFVTTCILSFFITRNIFLNHKTPKELAN